jgi:putative ABC transport system permease protein
MNGALLLHSVFARLARYKGKTALMILGIAIGVLAMVAITIFGEGAMRSFERYARIIYPTDSVAVAGDEGGEITLVDVEALRAAIPEIVDWDPLVRAGSRVLKNGDRNVRVGVQGYSERAAHVRRRGVQKGEFFTAADVAARARVALLGTTTVGELFGATSPVGAEIFIDNLRFEVRGVLESAGADLHGGDLDQAVWIPYTTALDDLLKSDSMTGASLQLIDPTLTEGVGERIRATLRERHAIPPGYVDDFTVTTPRGIGDQVSGMFAMIERFIAVVVTTVFGVAALIVVGVMLATVKQRSAEIGLRRALGARRRDLRLQIVLEVSVLSMVASALGLVAAWILLDALGPMLLDDLGVQVTRPSAGLALASVAAAVATGLVGSVPAALKAARLDPVEALR